MTKRTIAIADIHGCCRTFRRLLFDVVRLTKSDTLYLLGDMIDRGPDSKGVIVTILELQADGYDVRPITSRCFCCQYIYQQTRTWPNGLIAAVI